MKQDIEIPVGPVKARRRQDKYYVETPHGVLEFNTMEDVIRLRLALDGLISREWEEIQEERRARGQPTYVEYRGEEVVKTE